MKNIIPFKKDVIFKTNLSEITSISLENTLSIEENKVKGEFIITGEYKVSDTSTTVEPFNLNLPFEIMIDERFDSSKAIVDIDDFYYEIANNNVLSVSIDVLIDKLEEKPILKLDDLIDEKREVDIIDSDEFDIRDIEKNNIFDSQVEENSEIDIRKEENMDIKDIHEVKENTEKQIVEEKINSLFNQFTSDSDVYVTYNIFILRDGDNLDSVMEKYGVTEEELKKYNDLSNLKIGDKLIIPSNSYERD